MSISRWAYSYSVKDNVFRKFNSSILPPAQHFLFCYRQPIRTLVSRIFHKTHLQEFKTHTTYIGTEHHFKRTCAVRFLVFLFARVLVVRVFLFCKNSSENAGGKSDFSVKNEAGYACLSIFASTAFVDTNAKCGENPIPPYCKKGQRKIIKKRRTVWNK